MSSINDTINGKKTDDLVKEMKDRTLFVRTPRVIEEQSDFQLLYFFSMFGIKCFLKNELAYAKYKYNDIEFDRKIKEEFLGMYSQTVDTGYESESEASSSEESEVDDIHVENLEGDESHDEMDGETRNHGENSPDKVPSKGSDGSKKAVSK